MFSSDPRSDTGSSMQLEFFNSLFCTVYPVLRIILLHPRWRVLPASVKRTNKDRFCKAKAFIRNNNAGDRQTASWFAIEKRKVCMISKFAVVFHFAAIEFWNY